jgi:tetratricopeptide (TPR) repeat protein
MQANVIRLLEQGFALQQQGDLAAAERNYLEVLALDPNNEFALNLMGVVCNRRNQSQEAVTYLNRALQVNANDPETHNNLGLAFKDLHKFREARWAFEASLELNPKQPQTLNNLGNVLAATDQHDEAIAAFESAIRLDAGYVDCMNNLASSLKELGRVDDALSICDVALRLDDSNSQTLNTLGKLLIQAAQYEEAKVAFERAIECGSDVVARINLSTAFKQLGDEQAAVTVLNEVLRIEPHNAEAHNHLGVLHEQLGDTANAANEFRLALQSEPDHASSWYQLAKLKDQRLSEDDIAHIRRLIDDPDELDIFRSSLLFALACEAEKDKNYDASMQYLLRAQAIKAKRNPYDEAAPAAYTRAAKQVFPVRDLSFEYQNDSYPIPIFVIGMPRSGTTLTEQIVSSHSAIGGAGELGFINDLLKDAAVLTRQPYPASLAALSSEQALTLRRTYLTRLQKRVSGTPFVVDKNPLNFNLVGVIATLFPDARIIYCRRDPLDTCVSIFRLPFDDNQGYSHDLAALGHFYRQHEKLMEFWLSCYPKQIITVDYEDTVSDLEAQARRMLGFLGVEFESQVLRFFDNRRAVLTPSASQVRQPIYKDSVAAWKRYEKYLGPLIASLDANR